MVSPCWVLCGYACGLLPQGKRTGHLYRKARQLRLRCLGRGRDALTVELAHCGFGTQKRWFPIGPV